MENSSKKNQNIIKQCVPLELSKIILKDIQCEYKLINSKSQVYIKALQGIGNLYFNNGTIYKGKIQNGLLHGQGTIKWNQKLSFSGSFFKNKPEGHGKFTLKDGFYQGNIHEGVRNGFGIFKLESGIYQGQWKDGQMNGFGKLKFINGSIYQGNFYNNKKHGFGKYQYTQDNYYEGQWKENIRQGKGKMKTKQYYSQGEWKQNKLNGNNILIWYDDDEKFKGIWNRYEGNFVNNSRQGIGSFFYSNGSVFTGNWRKDMKDGKGIRIDQNGEFEILNFNNDRVCSIIYGSTQNKKDSKLLKQHLQNPFKNMINFKDLFRDDQQRQCINVICLRFNSKLKYWYKQFSSFNNEKYNKFMTISDIWRFIKKFRLKDHFMSISQLDRLFFKYTKLRYFDKITMNNIDTILKCVKNEQQFKNFYFIQQASNIQTLEGNDNLKQYLHKKIDIHDPQTPILYRQFVQIMILIAYNKYDPQKKKSISEKLVQIFQLCDKNQKQLKKHKFNSFTTYSHTSQFEILTNNHLNHEKENQIKYLFQKICTDFNQSYEYIDKTVRIKDLIKHISKDQANKQKILKYFNKQNYQNSNQHLKEIQKLQLNYFQFKQFMMKWSIKYDLQSIKIHPLDDEKSKDLFSKRYINSQKYSIKLAKKQQRQFKQRELQQKLLQQIKKESNSFEENDSQLFASQNQL